MFAIRSKSFSIQWENFWGLAIQANVFRKCRKMFNESGVEVLYNFIDISDYLIWHKGGACDLAWNEDRITLNRNSLL